MAILHLQSVDFFLEVPLILLVPRVCLKLLLQLLSVSQMLHLHGAGAPMVFLVDGFAVLNHALAVGDILVAFLLQPALSVRRLRNQIQSRLCLSRPR